MFDEEKGRPAPVQKHLHSEEDSDGVEVGRRLSHVQFPAGDGDHDVEGGPHNGEDIVGRGQRGTFDAFVPFSDASSCEVACGGSHRLDDEDPRYECAVVIVRIALCCHF